MGLNFQFQEYEIHFWLSIQFYPKLLPGDEFWLKNKSGIVSLHSGNKDVSYIRHYLIPPVGTLSLGRQFTV